MPEKATLRRARAKLRRGQAPSSAAGEFIREEIRHIREGKHGARSTKQAIAIGLSKARRAGVKLEAPRGTGPRARRLRAQAKRDERAAKHPHAPSATRSRATRKALAREPHRTVSKRALSRHAKRTAKAATKTRKRHERSGAIRSAAARGKAAAKTRSRNAAKRSASARTAAKTRAANAAKRSASARRGAKTRAANARRAAKPRATRSR